MALPEGNRVTLIDRRDLHATYALVDKKRRKHLTVRFVFQERRKWIVRDWTHLVELEHVVVVPGFNSRVKKRFDDYSAAERQWRNDRDARYHRANAQTSHEAYQRLQTIMTGWELGHPRPKPSRLPKAA